jgi:hypothetical protein
MIWTRLDSSEMRLTLVLAKSMVWYFICRGDCLSRKIIICVGWSLLWHLCSETMDVLAGCDDNVSVIL